MTQVKVKSKLTQKKFSMFCPTAVDQFFAGKFSLLDCNQNRKQEPFKNRVDLEQRKKEVEETRKK